MGCQRHRMCCSSLLLLLSVLSLTASSRAQQPYSYSVSKFDAAALKDWNVMSIFKTYAGDAENEVQVLNPTPEGVLSLTTADGDVMQSALAILNKEIPWGKGFLARFSFRLYDAGVNRNRVNGTAYDPTNPDVGGDGITFAIFSTLPQSPGGFGGALGYFQGDGAALPQSVAVEFDTWNNPEFMDPVNEGGVVGGDTNHIGLDLRGEVNSEKTVHINTPFNDGSVKNVWIYYFANQNTLQVFYNDVGEDRPASPVFTAQIDLNQVLGTDTQSFFAGFTAASATAYENQTVSSFSIVTLNGTEEPIKPLPQPEPIPDPMILIAKQVANYSDFNTKDWLPAGSAQVLPSGPLQLTTTDGVVVGPDLVPVADPGQATLQNPIDCTVGCSLYGAFAITNDPRLVDVSDLVAGGDGLAMVVTGEPTLPAVENTPGNLGYAGINKSVAVEVDTWFDKGIDPVDPKNQDGTLQLSGSDGNHLGVSVGGNPKSIATAHLPSPANDNQLTATGQQLKVKHVWADIDNINKEIKVFYNEANDTKPIAPALTAPLDLEAEVGTTKVYPSFTASTSGGLSNHYIVGSAFSEALAILNTTDPSKNPAVKAAIFPGFTPSTARAFIPAGTATNKTNDQGALTLSNSTAPMSPSAGSLSLIAPVNIADGLQLKASPRMTSNPGGEADPADGSTARDGVALVLVAEKPAGPGQPGSGIGYGGLGKSVAIELDTFYNPEHDPTDDGNHIGINVGGDLKSVASASIPDDMADGEKKYVWVDYDAQDKEARVYFNHRDVKPAAPVLTHPIDLQEVLGTTTPYLLVTSGTNGTAGTPATNELDAISFLNTKPPPPEATNITKFDAAALKSIARGGVTADLQPTADGAMPLTSGLKGPQAGLIRVGQPVDITQGLSAHIQVVLDGKGAPVDPADKFPGRDGVAIVLLPTNDTTPGLPASGIGYGGKNNTVAVELDTWRDAFDPAGDGNHIGVNTNGNLKSLSAVKLPANMADGKPKDVWLDYNNVAKALSVYYNSENSTKPDVPILTQTGIDVPAILKSKRAYVAVTSGTDGTAGSPTTQLLKSMSVTPGNPDATKSRSFDFADPAAAKSWEGGYGASKDGLSLTDPTVVGPQFGAAVHKEPLDITEGFSAYMRVAMTPGGPVDMADNSTGPSGIALVLLPTNSTAGDPDSKAGDGLGYASLNNSVAVELDSVFNPWDPLTAAGSDDGNHVGVNVGGSPTSVASAHLPKNLADAKPQHVWVDYNSGQKKLKVFVNPNAADKPLDPILVAPVDIEQVLGTTSPYVAVTSGTASPKAAALLKAFRVQPGRADASAAFAGPNSLSKVDAAGLQKLARSGAAAAITTPNADGSIPLTDPNVKDPQSSMLILPEPVDLTQGISSHFQIKMTSPAGANVDPADGNAGTGGATIAILPSNTTTQGGPDSGLGYQGIPGKSASVELDKFYDQSVTDPVNPMADGTLQVAGADGNHIGLNFDGSVTSNKTVHISRDFNSDAPNNVWLDYDPVGKMYVYYNGPNTTKPASPVLTADEDLAARLGGPMAYIAITAGTTNASTAVSLVSSKVVNVAPTVPSAAALGPAPATVLKDFNATTAAGFTVSGAAADVNQPDTTRGMKLTDPSVLDKQASLLVVSPRVDISKGLQSRFQFVFASNNETDDLDPADNFRGRDGAAIVLLGGSNITQGQPGGGLGYGGLDRSVAVELDSWHDNWDPLNSAGLPDGNHIGVNTNGDLNSIVTAPLTANLNDGEPKNVWVDVDSVSKVLYVYASDTLTKPDKPLLAVPVDVVGTLGTDKPILAVTSGTQGKSSVTSHFLKEVEFSSNQPKYELAAAALAAPVAKKPSPNVQTRSFTAFNPDTLRSFDLKGATSATTPDSYLQLNDPTIKGPQNGMATYKTPVDASTGFSVYVRPQITASANSPVDPADNLKGRDGMAVVLLATNTSTPGPEAQGSGIGYAGLQDSVAVELDNWMDAEDPDGNHVGINKHGNIKSEVTYRVPEDLSNGKDKHLWVDYDNSQKLMNVFMNTEASKPTDPVLSYSIDLPNELGTSMPYVAITSGTQDGAATHVVKALSFTSGEAAPNPKSRYFSSFPPASQDKDFTLSGSAVPDPYVPGAIALTTDQASDQSGLFKLTQPVDISQGVSTFMQFQMNNTGRAAEDPAGGPPGADGMTLMLLGDGAEGEGAAGSGLGYKGIKGKSLAMELDHFYNKDVDPVNPQYPWGRRQLNGDDGNHLGLDVNGEVKSVITSTVPLPLNDGQVHSAWMDVDNQGKMVHMYYNPDNDTKPDLPAASYPFDKSVADVLGTTTPTVAIAGGSTNGGTVHRLRALSVTPGPVANPFSFPGANGAGWRAWNLSGSAAESNGQVQLTTAGAGAGQVGRALLGQPVDISDGASVKFVADMQQSAGQPQDGLALAFTNTNLLPAPQGNMGYESLKRSVAVELDPFFNSWDPKNSPLAAPDKGTFSGDDGNHVGINVNGDPKSVQAVHIPEPLGQGTKHVWVDYDNAAKSLWVYLSNSSVKPADPVLSRGIDLEKELGTKWPYAVLTSSSPDGSTTTSARALSLQSGKPPAGPKTKGVSKRKKLSGGKIAGIVLGVIFGVIVLALCLWWLLRNCECCACCSIFGLGKKKQRKADPLYVV